MDVQTQTDKEKELAILLAQNQQLFNQRAETLFTKLQALLNGSNQMHLLQNIHLAQAIQYVEDTTNKKKRQCQLDITQEDEIEREIQIQLRKQNQILEEENNILISQIQQISKDKAKCQLAQKYTANRILSLQDLMSKQYINLYSSFSKGKLDSIATAFNFAYEQLPNGNVAFKKSFKQLVVHFLSRISDNQQIIQKLKNNIKQKIYKSQVAIVQYQKLKKMQQQYCKTIENINKLRNVCEFQKEELKMYVFNTNSQIQQRLPQKIEENIKQISAKNQSYERAYHEIYDIVKMVIDNAQIDKVNDYYINKQ